MIENLTDIEKTLKLPEGTLKSAIENAENVKIEIPSLKIYTEEEENTRLTNIRAAANVAGVEVTVKAAKEKLGLSFEGKTIDSLLEAHSKKVIADANINPDKRVADLTSDMDKLRVNLTAAETRYTGLESTIATERNERKLNDVISAKIPANTVIPKEDLLIVFKNKFAVDTAENGLIQFKQNNEVLKNPTTLNPLSIDEVMTSFITPYLKTVGGGAGGGDNAGADTPGTMAAFRKDMAAQSINEGSEKFNKEMQARIAAKTLTF